MFKLSNNYASININLQRRWADYQSDFSDSSIDDPWPVKSIRPSYNIPQSAASSVSIVTQLQIASTASTSTAHSSNVRENDINDVHVSFV